MSGSRKRHRAHPSEGFGHHEAFGPWGRHGQFFERALFGPPWGGGRRARRGDVRAAILALLADQPMHGYDLIRELEERSGGMWRPSPGSVYPTLQLLEDEGLVVAEDRDGRRVFALTDAGRAELEERRARGEGEPWKGHSLGENLGALRDAAMQLGAAVVQVARAGTDAQRQRATEILGKARKEIYRLLSES